MKRIKCLISSILFVLCLSFISCSKSDDISQSSFIVGQWSDSSSEEGEITVNFYSNRLFTYKRIENNEIVDQYSGTYIYNEVTSEGTLAVPDRLPIRMKYRDGKLDFVDSQGFLYSLRKQ